MLVAMSRSRRSRPRKNNAGIATTNPSGLAMPEANYGRDLLVSGVIGGIISTRVVSWGGVFLSAVAVELAIAAVSKMFPQYYPPDPSRKMSHRVAGIGAFVGGWWLGRWAQGHTPKA